MRSSRFVRSFLLILSLLVSHIALAQAQFIIRQDLSFGDVIKYEQERQSVKKADVRQGPLLLPTAPGGPEIEVYKRALVFQRLVGPDTLEIVYNADANKKIDDKTRITEGRFVWFPARKENLMTVRDGMLHSLDGTPRAFNVSRKKMKKGLVHYIYIWSPPETYPAIRIEYGERKRIPAYLRMQILYSDVNGMPK